MRRVRWSSVLVMVGVFGCGSDEPTTGTDRGPIVLPGGAGGSAGAGGTSAGSSLGGTTGGGGLIGIGGTSGGGLSGGFPGGTVSGGGIGMSMVQQMGPCEQQVAQAGPTVPDIMIVLDRSQSMAPAIPTGTNCTMFEFWGDTSFCALGDTAACNRLACVGVDCAAAPYQGTVVCGGMMPSPDVDRWTPAVQGIKTLTQQFQTKISFGLTVFPGDGAGGGGGRPGGGMTDLCAPGTQRVPTGLNTAGAIAMSLDRTQPSGATPTAAALQAAQQQIMQKMSDPDSKVPPQYVLLVTDGQPTCPNARGSTVNGGALQQDHALTIQALDALTAAGVKTYVLGYDASIDPALAKALTEFAMHGGTGDFHPVKDAASIVEQFTKITASVASCSYTLDKKPHDPTYVKVLLDGKQLDLDNPNGWSVDGVNVTIQGDSCTTLKDGGTHRLIVTVECDPVPPLQ
jgi:hypothetical protein